MDLQESNRRLLVLADFLETVPDAAFDYTQWAWSEKMTIPEHMAPNCGTTACALGWATAIPEFRALGLRLHAFGLSGCVTLKSREQFALSCGGGADESFGAARVVFGVDHFEAEHLFAPNNDDDDNGEDYATPREVAEKIRRFVKERA